VGFTPDDRPRRSLGEVIHDAGGIERFNDLMNPTVNGGPSPAAAPVHRRPRPRPHPSRPLPPRWWAQPPDPED
jgi:hypothetical protein